MNRAQKGSWFGLATSVLCIKVLFFRFSTPVSGFNTEQSVWYAWPIWRFWPVAASFLLLTIMFFVIRKKQSPQEVAFDERDKTIKTKAISASFLSVLVMLPTLACVMVMASDDEGMISVFMMPGISLLILFITMAVYSIATLVQYGKDGTTNE